MQIAAWSCCGALPAHTCLSIVKMHIDRLTLHQLVVFGFHIIHLKKECLKTAVHVGRSTCMSESGLYCRYLFIIDCTLNLMVFYGIMGVYVTADLSLANVLSSFFYGLWNLFTGFLIGVSQMAGWWKWL